MANTTNFNWETPDDTDLVKDGAAAIRTLGSAIDTSLVDLKGGTTGQVLSKATNTDMDFTWVAQDDSNAIQNAIVDAKGDLISATAADTPARLAVGTDNQRLVAASGEATGLKYVSDTQNTVIDAKGDLLVGSAADTLARLAVGTNDYVLTADSSATNGVKWAAAAAGGGFTSLASGSLSGSSTTVSITTTGYKQLVCYVKDVSTSGDQFPTIQFNSDTGSNYGYVMVYQSSSTAVSNDVSSAATAIYMDQLEASNADSFQVWTIYDPANTTTWKTANGIAVGRNKTNTFDALHSVNGYWKNTSAISSITFTPQVGYTYSTGTYEIYGVK